MLKIWLLTGNRVSYRHMFTWSCYNLEIKLKTLHFLTRIRTSESTKLTINLAIHIWYHLNDLLIGKQYTLFNKDRSRHCLFKMVYGVQGWRRVCQINVLDVSSRELFSLRNDSENWTNRSFHLERNWTWSLKLWRS